MKTGRNILIGALVALGAAGSVSVAAPAVTAASAPAHVVAGSVVPNTWYHQ